jgi:chromosome segregation ATPase
MEAELEKIIADGKKKYRAFEEADQALLGLKSLRQAVKDLSKTVEGLEKTRDSLKAEVSTLNDKVEAAQVKAADIIGAANAKAETAIENALKNINEMQDKASEKLAVTNAAISGAETRKIVAEGLAKEAESKLAELSAAVDKQKAALKKLIGE